VPSTVARGVARRGANLQQHGHQPDDSDALAVFVMYVILAILYGSYVHPLTVLSTLPTALVVVVDAGFCLARKLRSTRLWHVHVDGDCEEERDHVVDSLASVLMRRGSGGKQFTTRAWIAFAQS